MRKGERVVRRRLADGTVKEYRYARQATKPKPRYSTDTVGGALIAWRRSPEWAALADNTKVFYGLYSRVLEKIAAARLTDIRRRDLLDIRDALAVARGKGAANAFIRAASAFFGWCRDRDLLEHVPTQRIKSLPQSAIEPWTPAEVKCALEVLSEPLRRAVILALYTGQRKGDLVRMCWSQYDGTSIRLRQGKTKEKLVIPVHPVLKTELDEWRRSAKALVILTNHRGGSWRERALSTALRRAQKEHGLPERSMHGLRKLCAIELAEAGASVHVIAAITGHKTLAMVQHYTKAADQERLAEEAVRLWTGAGNRKRKTAENGNSTD